VQHIKFLDNRILDVNKTLIKPVITEPLYPPPEQIEDIFGRN
jgi:hypothetical protein